MCVSRSGCKKYLYEICTCANTVRIVLLNISSKFGLNYWDCVRLISAVVWVNVLLRQNLVFRLSLMLFFKFEKVFKSDFWSIIGSIDAFKFIFWFDFDGWSFDWSIDWSFELSNCIEIVLSFNASNDCRRTTGSFRCKSFELIEQIVACLWMLICNRL